MKSNVLIKEKAMKKSIASPIKVGTMELKNRMYAVPMVSLYADEDGNVTQRLIDIDRVKGKRRLGPGLCGGFQYPV